MSLLGYVRNRATEQEHITARLKALARYYEVDSDLFIEAFKEWCTTRPYPISESLWYIETYGNTDFDRYLEGRL